MLHHPDLNRPRVLAPGLTLESTQQQCRLIWIGGLNERGLRPWFVAASAESVGPNTRRAVHDWILSLPWHTFNSLDPFASGALATVLNPPATFPNLTIRIANLGANALWGKTLALKLNVVELENCELLGVPSLDLDVSRLVIAGTRFGESTVKLMIRFDGHIKNSKFSPTVRIEGDFGNTVIDSDCELRCDASTASFANVTWEVFKSLSANASSLPVELVRRFKASNAGLIFDTKLVSRPMGLTLDAGILSDASTVLGVCRTQITDCEALLPASRSNLPSNTANYRTARFGVDWPSVEGLGRALANYCIKEDGFALAAHRLLSLSCDTRLAEFASDFISFGSPSISIQSDADLFCRYEEAHVREFFNWLGLEAVPTRSLLNELVNFGCALSWVQSKIAEIKGPPLTTAATAAALPLTAQLLAAGTHAAASQRAGVMSHGWLTRNWENFATPRSINARAVRAEIESVCLSNKQRPGDLCWRISDEILTRVIRQRSDFLISSPLDCLEELYHLTAPQGSKKTAITSAISAEQRHKLAEDAVVAFMFGKGGLFTPIKGEIKLTGGEKI